ncbi:Transcriptional adapter ada2 [Knufia fluminis]|uniref:Transcriptional adapter 2 n=1 Tax=Knufia fluminis TaxID=191047 RepID=A0AAN8EJH8_9EURO|nr:Transcriptional adapter ada2 [Knufia fluminis]
MGRSTRGTRGRSHVAADVADGEIALNDETVLQKSIRRTEPRRSTRLIARYSTDPEEEKKHKSEFGESEGNSTTIGLCNSEPQILRRRTNTSSESRQSSDAREDGGVKSEMGVIRKAAASRGSDGGTKYHCDVCSIDITSTVRINCADSECRDYDLCVPCFSRGEKSKNHNPQTHAYRVVEQNSIPIYTHDWGADEELLMLEGSERYGLGSWADVAEHIGGYREKDEVRDHYIDTYINSSLFPLPELADPKNTEQSQRVPKEEFQARKKRRIEERQEAAKSAPPATPKQKPTASVPACHEVQGFMPGRLEFETEHLNDAEEAVQHMTFDPGDGVDPTTGEMDEETILKMTVFDIYNSKLVARAERKKIIFEHQLLEYKKNQAQSKRRTKEENDLLLKAKPFARLMNHDDFEAFCKDLLQEHNLRQAITQLQDWRMHGVNDLKQGDKYEIEKAARAVRMQPQGQFDRLAQYNPKRKEKAEENVPSEASKLVAPDLPLRFQRKPKTAPVFADTQPAVENEFDKMFAEANGNDSNQAAKPKTRYVVQPLNGVTPWKLEEDKSMAPDLQLLSEEEIQLCNALHIRPKPYLALKEGLLREAMKQGGTMKKKEARGVCRIDVNKANRIFDFMIHSGWITKA